MTDETTRWQRVEALFDALADLPPAERAARLAEVAASDAPLAARVAELLEADRRGSGFIDRTVADAVLAAPTPGRAVGAWRLLRELGQGGMGSVWLAERADGAYEARVAIKFLVGTMALPEMARRFRSERQFLADLSHPDIARLVDGGTTPDGTPYLVMEYVDGVPLDAWSSARRANVRTRVTLLHRVCLAVQHAHSALVVHRDLKPSNVLVTADGAPKLLDFGIATMLDAPRDGTREPTLYQALTPSYASPEHLRGERVTTASDTWSLGVMLYRLLAGVPPFDLASCSPAEVERRITAGPPPPPSVRATARDAALVRGDLDAITRKALHPDPAQRYGTAADLAADLRRWLDREPVEARAPTAAYRLRTFVRRHPAGVAAWALATLLLAFTTAASVVQAGRAARERDLAERRQRTAEGATSFLVALFSLLDPDDGQEDTISARTLLDVGAETIRDGVQYDAGVRATLTTSLASVYRNLAEYDVATSLLDTAVAVRGREDGEGSLAHARVLHELAVLQYALGRTDSALVLHRRVLAALDTLPAAGDDVLREATLAGLGDALSAAGRHDEAEPILRDAVALARRVHGDDTRALAQSLISHAATLRALARYDEAIPLLEEALAAATAADGRQNLDVAQALNHLGRTHALAGRPADGEPYVREAIAIQEAIHREAHPETAASLGALSGLLADLGRYDEAESTRRRSLAMLETVFPGGHPYVAGTLGSLATLQRTRGDVAAAESSYVAALRQWDALRMPDAPPRASALEGLGRLRVERGRAREALPVLREALAVRGGAPDASWQAAVTATALAEALLATGEAAAATEARRLATVALATLEPRFGPDDARVRAARLAARGGTR